MCCLKYQQCIYIYRIFDVGKHVVEYLILEKHVAHGKYLIFVYLYTHHCLQTHLISVVYHMYNIFLLKPKILLFV